MSKSAELIIAEEQARMAREQLTASLVAIQVRVTPRALAREAFEEIRDAGAEFSRMAIDAAKRNPGPLVGIAATVIALFARHWIADAFSPTKPAADGSDPQAPEGTPHD